MTLRRTPKLALATALCALATVPAAVAAPTHQTPVSHGAGHATRNALTTSAWTPMIDESRLDAPFNRPVADYAGALARFLNHR